MELDFAYGHNPWRFGSAEDCVAFFETNYGPTLKVRDNLSSYDQDPGWYQHPAGTVAVKATDADLTRDEIDVNVRVEGAAPAPAAPAGTPPAPSGGHRH